MQFKIRFRSMIARNTFTSLIEECGCNHVSMGAEIDDRLLGMIVVNGGDLTNGNKDKWFSVYISDDPVYHHISMSFIPELEVASRASKEVFWELFRASVPVWEPSAP